VNLKTILLACGVFCASVSAGEIAVVLDAASPRGKLLAEAGFVLKPYDDVLPVLAADACPLAVVDATPANLNALAGASDKLKVFTDKGGWVVLWGVTPEGLADFNKIVGVDHILRPFVAEGVLMPSTPDPLLRGLDPDNLYITTDKPVTGFSGQIPTLIHADDAWSYVLDTDDIAPFSSFPSANYWRPDDKGAVIGTDRYPPNMVNGLCEDWQLGFTIPTDKPEFVKWTFTFPRPETVTAFSIIPDTGYRKIAQLRLSFVGSDAKPVELAVKPEMTRQEFPILPTHATGLTLEILKTTEHKVAATGIRNLWIKVQRSDAFRQKVKPLLNIGVLIKYPMGTGGIIVSQLRIQDRELIKDAREKKKAILCTLLKNLGTGLGTAQ